MPRGRRLGEKSLKIMKALLDLGATALDDLLDMPLKHRMPWNYRGFFLKLYNLERQGYVAKQKKNSQSFFHLTPQGRLQILKYLHLEKIKIKGWDGRWRVIVFDIPEARKKLREYLRYHLKYLGFHPLQESVYVIPYPVGKHLDQYLKKNNLRKYCRYLTVSEIDDEEELRNIFGI